MMYDDDDDDDDDDNDDDDGDDDNDHADDDDKGVITSMTMTRSRATPWMCATLRNCPRCSQKLLPRWTALCLALATPTSSV